MSDLIRIGVTVDSHLLDHFDRHLEERGTTNRSEAIRDLIRDHLVDVELAADVEAMGTVTIVYDHHTRQLEQELTALQHDHGHHVVSSMHIHIDEHHCLEVIVLRGRVRELRLLADQLIGAKGVLHGKLVATTLEALAATDHHEEK